MISTKTIHVVNIGDFHVPTDTDMHALDGEACVKGLCGRYEPALATSLGEWGHRCGQEYSYLGRGMPEDVATVLDIGHNVGGYFVWACREWWPGTVKTVHAFDPNPMCNEIAALNIALVQRCTEVILYQRAVTTETDAVFHEDARPGCSWTSTTQDAQFLSTRQPIDGGRPVPSIHPGDLPAADAVKIDAEGIEGEVLVHYPHWASVKVAQIEWHTHENRILMFDVLRRAGLTLVKNDCGEDQQGVACWVRK